MQTKVNNYTFEKKRMLPEFNELFSYKNKDFSDVEKIRKQGRAKSRRGFFISVLIEIFVVYFSILLFKASHPFWTLVVFIVGTILFLVIWISVNLSATKTLKIKLFNSFFQKIGVNFTYANRKDYQEELNSDLHFFIPMPGSHVDDVFVGKVKNLKTIIADKNIVSDEYGYISGGFAKIEAQTDLPDIYIFPRNSIYQNLFKIDPKLKEVNFFDENFNASYVVLSTDVNATFAVLNPFFIDYLVKINNTKRYLKITSKKILVLSESEKALFEVYLSNKITEKVVSKFYEEFKEQYNLIENIYSFIADGVGKDEKVFDENPPLPDENQENNLFNTK